MSDSWKQFDPQQMTPGEVYGAMIRAITPRPIAWVSSCDQDGRLNLAPFSFFNGVCSHPPTVAFSPVNRPDGSQKDTVLNIESTGQFVVNMVSAELARPMHQTSAEYPREVDEFAEVGVTPLASERVRPPRVSESPLQMECELTQVVRIGEGGLAANLILGKILIIHARDSVLDERGKIDADKVDTIGRMGGRWYSNTRQRFELNPPTL